MAPRCGCGSSGTCNCLITAGDNIVVTGAGSPGNPYIVTGTGGGGGGASCVTTTIADLIDLQDAGGLDVCATYIVTDWSTPNALPGPNFVFVKPVAVDKLNEDVRVYATTDAIEPVLGLYTGPVTGKFYWGAGAISGMYQLETVFGNVLKDIFNTDNAGSVLDSWVYDTIFWTDNYIQDVTFTGGHATLSPLAAASPISNNRIVGGVVAFGTAAAVSIQGNTWESARVRLGAATTATLLRNNLKPGDGSSWTVDLNGHTAVFTMTDCDIKGVFPGAPPSIQAAASSNLVVRDCDLHRSRILHQGAFPCFVSDASMRESEIQTVAGGRSLDVLGVDMLVGGILQNSSGTFLDIVRYSKINGVVQFTGAADPATNRQIENVQVFAGTLTVDDSSNSSPVSNGTLENATLTLSAGNSSISSFRVSSGVQLTTGAFNHNFVYADGSFTQTLTANNTNTYRGFGANTLI